MLICQNLICDIYYVLNPERMLLCLQKNGNMLANKRRNNRITKKVCGVFRVIPERIAFEITQFKGVIPAKSTLIAAVDSRMVPLPPTGTARRAVFGRFAGIHAALLSMPVRPLDYRHGPTGRPSGRSSRRASPCSALQHFKCECCKAGKWGYESEVKLTRKKKSKK